MGKLGRPPAAGVTTGGFSLWGFVRSLQTNGFHPSGAGAGTEHPTASFPHAAGMLLLPALQQLELESVKGGR